MSARELPRIDINWINISLSFYGIKSIDHNSSKIHIYHITSLLFSG